MLEPFYGSKLIEAGCDEAGRGSLAGPVFAAAVILPRNIVSTPPGIESLLDDSKKFKELPRRLLRAFVEQKATAWAVAKVDNTKIDKINILNASFLAMHKALDKLNVSPELLLIDGNRFNAYKNIPHKCIIKGDGTYMSIAAASILAKSYRDDFMKKLHEKFPKYEWNSNKGYCTKKHRQAIQEYGISPYHRNSFRLLQDQLKLDLRSK